MSSIICSCSVCNAEVGTVTNHWFQIGKKFITPASDQAIKDAAGFRLSAVQSTRMGEPGTLVGGCKLQDVECRECHEHLGLMCQSTPANHVLRSNQVIFRVSSIELRSVRDLHHLVEPTILRVLQLRDNAAGNNRRDPITPPSADSPTDYRQSRDSMPYDAIDDMEMLQLHAEVEAQRNEMSRMGIAGFQLASSVETTVSRLESRIRELDDTVDRAHAYGDGLKDDLKSLKRDMAGLKASCAKKSAVVSLEQNQSKLRALLDEVLSGRGTAGHENNCLQKELSHLKDEVAHLAEENQALKAGAEEAKVAAKRGLDTSQTCLNEMAVLRSELKQVQSELAKERARSVATTFSSSVSNELDILANSVSKIGDRASQIETLRMEFDLFKARINRLEQDTSDPEQRSEAQDESVKLEQEHLRMSSREAHKSKRKSSAREDVANNPELAKRRTLTDGSISSRPVSKVTAAVASAASSLPPRPVAPRTSRRVTLASYEKVAKPRAGGLLQFRKSTGGSYSHDYEAG